MNHVDINSVYRKAEAIADELRSRIVAGAYQPGEKLPSRNAMMMAYDVSKVTVQHALDQLAEEGFVFAKDRSGTFVAERAPHLTNYALLFSQSKEEAEKNHFFRALAKAAKEFDKSFKLDLHYGFAGAEGAQQYGDLVDAVEKHRIAGLLFASPPHAYVNTPILDTPNIPRSAFMSKSNKIRIPSVSVDGDGLLKKAIGFIKAQGCQRPAVIMSALQSEGMTPRIQEEFAAAGVKVCPDWFLGADFRTPTSSKNMTRLLMAGSRDERPDCVFVTDDNILPAVSEALADIGIVPPKNTQLLAHCNYPWPTPSAVPAVRLGYSMTECIKAMMGQIRDQQNGKRPQAHIKVPAYFENEYADLSNK